MQEATDSHKTTGDSCSPKASVESGRSPDGAGLASAKSKKRDRPDQSAAAGKKAQLMEDCTISSQKLELTENLVDDISGLVSAAAVDELVSQMKQGTSSSLQRIRVAKILVATSKADCLKKFVFLGGVSTLEEWIQESGKIRSADGAVNDSDRALDEEIMVILQALEKLPISLETLKGCTVGKSVKQLRSIRNGEIQKKAKKLVDTWRKRVDLEMKQNCIQPVLIPDRLQQADAMSYASDHSPSNVTEVNNEVAVKSGSIQEGSNLANFQTLQSIASNEATVDGSPDKHVKSSAEKDTIKRAACPLISSFAPVTDIQASKRKKLSSSLCADEDNKDEAWNAADYQNFKEKSSNGEISSNHTAIDIAAKKTNEYRKKLRSGSSGAAPCSIESNAISVSGMSVRNGDNNAEKVTNGDDNVGDSEEHCTDLHSRCPDMESAGVQNVDEACDFPGVSNRNRGNKDENDSCLTAQGGKLEHTNESSQSSCSRKRNVDGPNALMEEKIGLLSSAIQGDGKLYPIASCLSEQENDPSRVQDVMQASSKRLESGNNRSDEVTFKLIPKSESNPSRENMVNVLSERNGPVSLTHSMEVGGADCEESRCSHNSQSCRKVGAVIATVPERDDNVEHRITQNSLTNYHVNEMVATADEAARFESKEVATSTCQELANEAANSTKASLSVINGSKNSDANDEFSKACTAPTEVPASTQSCHDFDLNEGLVMEDFGPEIQPSCGLSSSTCCVVPKVTGTLSAPIAVSAATKGAFIPSLNAPSKSDIGWRGSAATSAFRPAEPRHASAKMQSSAALATTEARNVNNFDLNVSDNDFDEPSLLPCQGVPEARLDLNYDGKVTQTMRSVSDASKHPEVGSSRNCGEKHAVLNFDLNEQLNEVPKEHDMCPTSAPKTYDSSNPYGGLAGNGYCGDYGLWKPADGAFYPGSAAAVGSRIELFVPGSATQPVASSRQGTAAPYVSPPSTSFFFSQAAPFFGGSQPSFPPSFTYNPISVGPDTSFMVSKGMPGTVGTPMDVRSRTEMSGRPAFLANIDDPRGVNNFFSWGGAPQNIYGNAGATIVSYNDVPVGGREHVVTADGNASLEQQMHIFQQAAVPVSSFKRRDLEYIPGLKQTTWQ